ncbi:helix-turn-helix domain-containing protein [Flavobacterium sp. RSB2_4_14]|uniref:helix-turn-helix domain-containing protein n=1 Tax=Flavobacterium sp. RSB2_4_14 TaxID=3447665 RepID=UPI003F319AE6
MEYIYKTYKYFLFIMFFVLFSSAIHSQSLLNKQYLSNDIEQLLNSKPDQALKIAQHLLSKTNISNNEKAKINFLISKTYKVKGDYSSALNFLYEEKNYESYLSQEEKINIEIEKIKLLRELSLDKQAKKTLQELEENFSSNTNEQIVLFLKASITLEKVQFLLKEDKVEEGLNLLQNQEIFSKEFLTTNQDLNLYYTIVLAETYLEKKDFAKSQFLYSEALSITNTKKNTPIDAKIDALLGLANLNFLKQKHNEVSLLLNEAIKNSQGLNNVFFQEKIVQQQIVNYLALNDTSNYKLTNAAFIQNQLKSEIIEQEAINTAYNLVSDGYNDSFIEQKESNFTVLYIVLGLFLVMILGCLFYWWKVFQNKVHLREIIKYIEITTSNFTAQIVDKKPEPKKNIILKETEELILSKLKRFENSKRFNNKDISLSVLAGQFDTNTKYLSEVINSHYNMNFNSYINRLRINYIVEKLKTDPNFMNYKISYLAENCGFSSHSSFATVFKSITGISPVTFIELLNSENENKLVS